MSLDVCLCPLPRRCQAASAERGPEPVARSVLLVPACLGPSCCRVSRARRLRGRFPREETRRRALTSCNVPVRVLDEGRKPCWGGLRPHVAAPRSSAHSPFSLHI